jgi:hypothetical protein
MQFFCITTHDAGFGGRNIITYGIVVGKVHFREGRGVEFFFGGREFIWGGGRGVWSLLGEGSELHVACNQY